MTEDGVNDALALQHAHVGVAMGKNGGFIPITKVSGIKRLTNIRNGAAGED